MAVPSRRLTVCLILAVALAVAGTAWGVPRLSAPDVAGTAPEEVVSVNPSMRQTLMEAADRFLETDPHRIAASALVTKDLGLKPHVFCHEDLIEVRRKTSALLLGLVVRCEELARSGNELVGGSGYITALLLTMESAGGRWNVRRVEEAGDGSVNIPSIRRMFSPAGVPRALELAGVGSDMEEGVRMEARQVFGLPADAKVRVGGG